MKQEASGWNHDIQTPEQREAFLVDYEAHEGVKLDPAKMTKNPGARTISKLSLNTLWGKFGQHDNSTQDRVHP